MLKKAIIVGASSGIGAKLIGVLVREGYDVVALARREDQLAAQIQLHNSSRTCVWAIPHDVSDVDSVRQSFLKATEILGGLDLLVYVAGVMPRVGIDEWPTESDHQMFQINVMGAVSWMNLAAPFMVSQRRGTLVAIGSVAGDRGRRGQPGYCASKAALHTFMESVRNRVSQHGVSVVTVKPGPVHTPMTEGIEALPMAIAAEAAAEGVYAAIKSRKTIRYVPGQWRFIMTVIRWIPSVVFRRLDI